MDRVGFCLHEGLSEHWWCEKLLGSTGHIRAWISSVH